jgi:hypothetical protein
VPPQLQEGQYLEPETAAGDTRKSKTHTRTRPPVIWCILRMNWRSEEHEGKSDESLTLPREAVDHGLSPTDGPGIETNPDLKSFHGRFPIHRTRRRNQKARYPAAQKSN